MSAWNQFGISGVGSIPNTPDTEAIERFRVFLPLFVELNAIPANDVLMLEVFGSVKARTQHNNVEFTADFIPGTCPSKQATFGELDERLPHNRTVGFGKGWV